MKPYLLALIIVFSTIFILILTFFVILRVIYNKCFYNPIKGKYRHAEFADMGDETGNRIQKEGLEFSKTLSHSDHYITSQDGLKLYGRYYIGNPDSKTIVLEFHGYKGNCVRDMTGGLPFDMERGFNIFMVDHRGHGSSDGEDISFGVKERFDVVSWCNYLIDKFGDDITIYLYGASMGAATVLMASDLELPTQVKGIIADCPYSDPVRMVEIGADLKGFHSKIVKKMLVYSAKVFSNTNLNESSAIKSVKNTKLPILLIHGEKDTFVPCSMSYEIKNANPEMIEFHTFKEADHALSFALYTEEYFDYLVKFMHKTN